MLPAEPLREWVREQLGSRATIAGVRSLHGGESPWWIDATTAGGSAYAVAALNTPTELWDRHATGRRDDFLRAAVARL